MNGVCRVEAKGNAAWCPPVSVIELRSFSAWVVKNVHQETIRPISNYLNINLLPRRITVQKESGH
jgi:hypothetical protein